MDYQENCFINAFGVDANDYLFEETIRALENEAEEAENLKNTFNL